VEASSDNKMSLEGNTYSFEDVAQFLVRLQLIPALAEIDLASAGEPIGSVDDTKGVKALVGGHGEHTQPPDAPLPMSQVELEVEGYEQKVN